MLSLPFVEKEKSKSGKRDTGAFTIEEVCDIQNFSEELGARLKLHNLRGTFKFVLRSTNKFSAQIFCLINATKLHKFRFFHSPTNTLSAGFFC